MRSEILIQTLKPYSLKIHSNKKSLQNEKHRTLKTPQKECDLNGVEMIISKYVGINLGRILLWSLVKGIKLCAFFFYKECKQ